MADDFSVLKRGRSRKEAARRIREHYGLPCSDAHLANMAGDGTGPQYRKVCGRSVYLDEDIDDWARSRIGPPIRRAADAERAA